MTIENIENKDDSDGRSILTVTGRSLESVMENRLNRNTNILTGGAPVAVSKTGTPGFIARSMFNDYCRNNTAIPADNIPFITAGSLYPASTISESEENITIDFPYETVYQSIKYVCDIYGLGFRLYRGPDTSMTYFDVYSGNDRTSSQSTLPAVIFSPDLENLTNVAEFSSVENHKNVAYVIAQNGTRVVYAIGYDATTSGFDRKVLFVDATDIAMGAGTTLQDMLEKRGKDALAAARALTALDGELPQNSNYRYGVDYELGDLVEMRNDDGITNRMRITEQIFVDDEQGERSYPTLAIDEFITPGSWMAWDFSEEWDMVPDTDFWDTV
jgi:hypothetical protein